MFVDGAAEDPRAAAEIIPFPTRPTESPTPEAGDFVTPKVSPNAETERKE